MRCRDGTPYPDEWVDRLVLLLGALDTIREAWGRPIVIVSGYRTEAHNSAISGAGQSQHVRGRAADIRPLKKGLVSGDIHDLHRTVNSLLKAGRLEAVGGVGVYPLIRDGKSKLLFPGWVHVDTRPRPENGHIARWEGEKFGDEQVMA
jgi:uncharacterized protein YcbK (DUF882 family)